MKKILISMMILVSSTISCAKDPIKVVVGYGAGTLDRTVRIMIADAEQHGSMRFTVENRPGANGQIALSRYFSSDEKDSAAIGVTAGQILFEPLANPKNNYLDKLRIIGPVVSSPLSIGAGPKSTITDVGFLFDKSQPRRSINIGSAGESGDMLIKLIMQKSHHDIVIVRFKGSESANVALIGGHIDLTISAYGDFKAKSEFIKVLAVAQKNSIDGTPSLQKYVPNAEVVNFFAISVSKDQPNFLILADALQKGLTFNGRISQFESLGYQVDMNQNNDFLERKVLPVYKQWASGQK